MHTVFFSRRQRFPLAPNLLLLATFLALSGCTNDSPSKSLAPAATGQDARAPALTANPEGVPKVDAGANQLADPQVIVTLSGSASAADDASVEDIHWTQISGPAVTLAHTDQLTTSFSTPVTEMSEQLVFRLSVFDNLGRANADQTFVTIQPFDSALRVEGETVPEGEGRGIFLLTLTQTHQYPVTLHYRTVDGSAKAGEDYIAASGAVTIPAGETEARVPVSILTDDIPESDETLYLVVAADGIGTSAASVGTLVITGSSDATDGAGDQDDLVGQRGIVRVNLEWPDDENDLDIHVFDPCGNQIYYGSREATCQDTVGTLDVDNIDEGVTDPVENIYWNPSAPQGEFRIVLSYAGGNGPSDYVITAFYGDQSRVFSGTIEVGESREIFSFTY